MVSTTAITSADRLWSTRHQFKRRVDAALELIQQATQHGTVGIAYSAGKDSTVLFDLIRQVIPDAPAAHFDSGAEYAWTYDLVRELGVETITPEMSIIELARYAQAWGYRANETEENEYRRVDYDEFLIYEPFARFAEKYNLGVVGLGLRGQESYGRMMNVRTHGDLYYAKYNDMWHLCPLARWKTEDIWAYIASRGLAYNKAYDLMAQHRIPRESWRVSTLLSYEGARQGGRFSALRQIDPERFYALAEEFPDLLKYS